MLKSQRKPILNTVALSVVAIVFLVAGLALAQGPGQGMGCKDGKFGHGGHGAGPGMACEEGGSFNHIDRMALRLDLSDDQKVAIEKLHDDNKEKNIGLQKEMMVLRNKMQGEMMKDDPSEKTVLGISTKMNAVKGELHANRLKTKLAVRALLTEEQRDQMLLMGGPGHGKGGKGHGQKGGFHGKGGCNGKTGAGCGHGGPGSQKNCR